MAKGRGRKKVEKGKNVANAVSDDQEGGTTKENKLVNLSSLAKEPRLARQDKRTNEDHLTNKAEKNTKENNTSTMVSLSHKKGKLKHERYVLDIMRYNSLTHLYKSRAR